MNMISFIYKIFRKIKNFIFINTNKILHKNLKIGHNLNFRKNLIINCTKSAKILIGDNVFFNNYCSLNSHHLISIGNDCIFGENVKIYDHNHVFYKKNIKIAKQGFSDGKIEIGENCWFGSNVVILPNTKIGDNVVVGAGVVLNGNIPSNCIVKLGKNYYIEKINYK